MNDQKQHAMLRVTERPSLYDNLEQKTVMELITAINAEDMKVAPAIREALPALENSLPPSSASYGMAVGCSIWGAAAADDLPCLIRSNFPTHTASKRG